mgnify:CR=1 FL=1
MSQSPTDVRSLTEEIRQRSQFVDELLAETSKVVVGQRLLLERLLLALLCDGHVLLEGVPGLGKTMLVRTLGEAVNLQFHRIQFTPDLMPADILGSEVLDESEGGRRQFRFVPGPVFCQLMMADEINRASPRTQSALLQAMQEHHVTVAGARHDLPRPFHVLATQNPIEQEGTYPLPEAQLDRFMFHIVINHPPYDEEIAVIRQTTAIQNPQFERPVSGEDLIAFQRLDRKSTRLTPVTATSRMPSSA